MLPLCILEHFRKFCEYLMKTSICIDYCPTKEIFILKSGLTIKHEYLRTSYRFSHLQKMNVEIFLTFSRHYTFDYI